MPRLMPPAQADAPRPDEERRPSALRPGEVRLPYLATPDTVVAPGLIGTLTVVRETSRAALDRALLGSRRVVLLLEDGSGGLASVGTVCEVIHRNLLPHGKVRVVLKGLARARAVPDGEGAVVSELVEPVAPSAESEAARRVLVEAFAALAARDARIPAEALDALEGARSSGPAADAAAHHLPVPVRERQRLLETLDPLARAEAALRLVAAETELLDLEEELRSRTEGRIGREQRAILLREKMRSIQEELGDAAPPSDAEILRGKAEGVAMPEGVRAALAADLARLDSGPRDTAEAATLRHSIETVLAFPWTKRAAIEGDVGLVRARLDARHSGLTELKHRVVELAAMARLGGKGAIQPLLLVGPPGVGKTSAARGIAEALGLPFAAVALGGVRDEGEIRGHRRAYVGASIGRLAGALSRAGVTNPVVLLDELDKIDPSGGPAAALLEALDAEQSGAFLDNYLGHAIDLSGALFVATANSLETIPGALRDRFEIVEMPSYSARERLEIARDHLWPRALAHVGLDPVADADRLSHPALTLLTEGYCREPGVRDLGRKLAAIARTLALEECERGEERRPAVKTDQLERMFGPPEPPRTPRRARPGATYALMVSGRGGEVVPIEAAILSGEGSGQLTVTGLVGPAMLESARTALAWLRANGEWPRGREAHVHAGEAGVPKDGPSAGLPLALSLASAAGTLALREEIAATGEIDLLGMVHPVGGVREKLLAAARDGIKTALIPIANLGETRGYAEDLQGLEVCGVRTVEEALAIARRDRTPGDRAASLV